MIIRNQQRATHSDSVYSEDLCKTPILATCPPDGVVLNPFCGSGTTNKVAYDLHRKSIGIDISEEYISMAKQRLSQLQLNMIYQYQKNADPNLSRDIQTFGLNIGFKLK